MIPSIPLLSLGLTPAFANAFDAYGACMLENAMPKELAQELLDRSHATLTLSTETLGKIQRSHAHGGYVPAQMEMVLGKYQPVGCAMFDLVSPHFGETKFTQDIKAFEAVMRRAYTRAYTVATHALRALDAAWRTDFENGALRGPHMIRSLDYPKHGPEIRFPAHRDFGLLSLFVAETAPGMQCLIDGVWTDIAIPPGHMLAVAGTAMAPFRHGLQAFLHRAVGRERTSAVFFIELRADVLMPNGETSGDRLDRMLKKTLRLPS